jgi:hypothetical protein
MLRSVCDTPEEIPVPHGLFAGRPVGEPVGALRDLCFDLAEWGDQGGIGDVSGGGNEAGDHRRVVPGAACDSGDEAFDAGVDDSGEVGGVGEGCLVDGSAEEFGDVEVGVLGAAEFGDEGAVCGGGLEGCLVGWIEAAGGDGLAVAGAGVELAEVFVDGD